MKCLFALFAILICGLFSVNAQQNDLIQLERDLKKARSVIDSIDILNDYADTLCLHKSEVGKDLAWKALHLSRNNNYYKGIGEASHSLGLTFFRRNNDSALYFFHHSHAAYLQQYPGFSKFVLTLNNISRTHNEKLQFDSAAFWANQAIIYSRQSTFAGQEQLRWLMYSHGAMTDAYEGLRMFDSSTVYNLRAISFAAKINDGKMSGVYLKRLAQVQAVLKNYDKAISYSEDALKFAGDDKRAITFLLSNIGSYYCLAGDLKKAALFADSSLRLGKKINVYNMVGRNFLILGDIHMRQSNYNEALRHYKEGLQQAIKFNNSQSAISSLYRKMGEVFEKLDSLPQAKGSYSMALETSEKDAAFKSETGYLRARLAFKEGDFSNAYRYLLAYLDHRNEVYESERIKTIQELNARYDIELKNNQLELLSKDKALQQQKVFNQLQQIERDKTIKHEQELQLANYELKDERLQQELFIQRLALENQTIRQKEQETQLAVTQSRLAVEKNKRELSTIAVRNQRNWFVYLASAFVVSILVGFLLFNRYRLLQKIRLQNNLGEQRQRISRDLHDEVGATLSGLSMYCHVTREQVKKEKSVEAAISLHNMQRAAADMVDKLNDIIWLTDSDSTLSEMINRLEEWAVNMASLKNMQVKVKVAEGLGNLQLKNNYQKNIYLFAKEAINNSVKYSGANILELELRFTDHRKLSLFVSDDGRGFDIHSVKRGNGLNNMQKRAEEIGADYSITPDRGTCCKIEITI